MVARLQDRPARWQADLIGLYQPGGPPVRWSRSSLTAAGSCALPTRRERVHPVVDIVLLQWLALDVVAVARGLDPYCARGLAKLTQTW